jgi:hypothetical protein
MRKVIVIKVKSEKSQEFVSGPPDGICRLNSKSKINYWNTKTTNQNEIVLKRTMFCT